MWPPQWSVVHGLWSMVHGQWSVVKELTSDEDEARQKHGPLGK
jgi:hypothetical protein